MRLIHRCNVCGSDRIRPYALSFGEPAVHNSMASCACCGMYFANPMRTEEELNHFYATVYYAESRERQIAEFPTRVAQARAQLAAEVVTRRPPSGRFLEIGCGYGSVLVAARELGYEVVGSEPGDAAREFAVREHGLDVRPQMLEQCHFEDTSFDVIYGWHVIEHVPDMARFLREVRRVLKPGGVFFFGTENYRCLPNRYSRAMHLLTGSLPALDTADEHTFLFTPASVRSIFPRFGYRVASVRAYQPTHKRDRFFAPAQRNRGLKRVVHMAVLGAVYWLAVAWPGAGAHMHAAVMRDGA